MVWGLKKSDMVRRYRFSEVKMEKRGQRIEGLKLMANDHTILDQLKQDDLTHIEERKFAANKNKFSEGNIVYKRDTGMAHRIAGVSFANGIEHYNLICSETNSCYLLSKYALDRDYTEDIIKIEKFGLKMVKRLSELWGK